MANGPDRELLGRTIAGKFTIESFVGGGAMGAVYKARQIALEKHVAVKVMHRELAADPAFAARFGREALAASRLDHPNSIRVLDFGEEPDGLVYIAMELVEGRDLGHLLDEGPLGDERIIAIVSQTLAALAVAHELGVIHRDIKPENILVLQGTDDEGQPTDIVKVCDFGIAKIADPRAFHVAGEPRGAATTATGALLGTPEYMSPEHARGTALDARADLYSLGVVLFRLLTGMLPFDADSAIGIAVKQIYEEPTPPSRLRTAVNPRLEAICLKALKKDPRERYQTAREMRAEIRAVAGDGRTTTSVPSDNFAAGLALALDGAAPPRDATMPPPPGAGLRAAAQAPETQRSSTGPTLVAPLGNPARTAPSSSGARRAVAVVEIAPAPGSPERSPAARGASEGASDTARLARWGLLFLVAGGLAAFLFARVRTPPEAPARSATSATPPAVAANGSARVVSAEPPPPALDLPPPSRWPSAALAAGGASSAVPGSGLPPSPADAGSPPDAASPAMAHAALAPPPPPRPTAAALATAAERADPPPSAQAAPPAPAAPPATAPPGAPPVPAAPEPAPVPAVPAPPVPAAPPLDLDAARVTVGAVSTTSGVSGVNVRSALGHVSFTGCYRTALRAAGSGVGGTANLHLAIDETGYVTAASASGLGFLPGAKACIEAAARGIQVRGVDTGDATADAVLTFSLK